MPNSIGPDPFDCPIQRYIDPSGLGFLHTPWDDPFNPNWPTQEPVYSPPDYPNGSNSDDFSPELSECPPFSPEDLLGSLGDPAKLADESLGDMMRPYLDALPPGLGRPALLPDNPLFPSGSTYEWQGGMIPAFKDPKDLLNNPLQNPFEDPWWKEISGRIEFNY